MYQHMEGLLLRLQHSEEALDDRLGRLEETLRAQLAALQAEHAEASSRWMLPYIALCSLAGVIGLWGLKQYRALNKLHKY
jgi:cytosine/adenosine deaminase-related metal-dependent hydrolase